MTKPRFAKGELVPSAAAAMSLAQAGRWLFVNGKAYHPGWVLSWPCRELLRYAEQNLIHQTIDIRGEKK